MTIFKKLLKINEKRNEAKAAPNDIWSYINDDTLQTEAGIVKIVYDSELLKQYGFTLCGAVNLLFAIPPLAYSIATYDVFSNAPKRIQDALISHEVGHIVLGHLDNPNCISSTVRVAGVITGNVSPIEMAADEYAANCVGTETMIDALKYMMRCRTVSMFGKAELAERIKVLQSNK